MESMILKQVAEAMKSAISSELVGYGKPLSKLTEKVVNDNSDELYGLINDEFVSLLNGDGFKESLREALHKKLAKTIVARMGGELEKRVNELNQNPETRAKITLAISKIVEG